MATQKKGRKVGRAKDACKAYRNAGRREVNKVKKHLRILASLPHVALAKQSLTVIRKFDLYLMQATNELKRVGAQRATEMAVTIKSNPDTFIKTYYPPTKQAA